MTRFVENHHYLGIRSKIANHQFQIGKFRSEFGPKIKQSKRPILKNTVAYKKGVVLTTFDIDYGGSHFLVLYLTSYHKFTQGKN